MVEAIIALLAAAPQVVGGVEAVMNLISVYQAGGALTDEQVDDIRTRGALADNDFDVAVEAAKQRLKP